MSRDNPAARSYGQREYDQFKNLTQLSSSSSDREIEVALDTYATNLRIAPQIASHLENLAFALSLQGRHDVAISIYQIAEHAYRANDDPTSAADCAYSMASSMLEKGDRGAAYRSLMRASAQFSLENMAPELAEAQQLISVLHQDPPDILTLDLTEGTRAAQRGMIAAKSGDWSTSYGEFEMAYHLFVRDRILNFAVSSATNLAAAAQKLADPRESIEILLEAEAMFRSNVLITFQGPSHSSPEQMQERVREAIRATYIKFGMPRSAIPWLKGALSSPERQHSTVLDLSQCYWECGEYDLAKEVIDGAREAIESSGHDYCLGSMLRIEAMVLERKYMFSKAASKYQLAINSFEAAGNGPESASACIDLAVLLTQIGDPESLLDAQRQLDLADPQVNQPEHLHQQVTSLSTRAAIQDRQGHLEAALRTHQQALDTALLGGNVRQQAECALNLGSLQNRARDYSSSLDNLRIAEKLANQYELAHLVTRIQLALAYVYHGLGHQSRAERHLDAARSFAESRMDWREIVQIESARCRFIYSRLTKSIFNIDAWKRLMAIAGPVMVMTDAIKGQEPTFASRSRWHSLHQNSFSAFIRAATETGDIEAVSDAIEFTCNFGTYAVQDPFLEPGKDRSAPPNVALLPRPLLAVHDGRPVVLASVYRETRSLIPLPDWQLFISPHILWVTD